MCVNTYAKYVAMNLREGLTFEQAEQVAKIQVDLFLNLRDLPVVPVAVKISSVEVVISTPGRNCYYNGYKNDPMIVNWSK